jgi:hypothetical protein
VAFGDNSGSIREAGPQLGRFEDLQVEVVGRLEPLLPYGRRGGR